MEQYFWQIIIGIFFLFISIIGYFMKAKIQQLDEDLKALQHEMDEHKDNYLSRFEKLTKGVNDSRIEILHEMNNLKILIIENKNK